MVDVLTREEIAKINLHVCSKDCSVVPVAAVRNLIASHETLRARIAELEREVKRLTQEMEEAERTDQRY